MSEKNTKAEVHYRVGGFHARCEKCTMFREARKPGQHHTCTAVMGAIGRMDLCDLYEPKQKTGG